MFDENDKNKYWNVISNYESNELVKKQYFKYHNLSLNTSKANEICTGFTQARGYMNAAEAADRNVRPLLVYYGILSLSRALTLFLLPRLREAGLAQSHGLTAEAWGEELSKDGSDVSTLKLKINKNGTFKQLAQATGHQSFLRNNSSAPNYRYLCSALIDEYHITLGELFSRLPEIRSVYMRWRSDRCAAGIWPQKNLPDGSLEVRVDSPFTMDDITAVLGNGVNILSQSEGIIIINLPKDTTLPSQSDIVLNWNIGSVVAMKKYDCGIEFSKICSAFLASYVLGMLVRYYPSKWIDMLQNRNHNAALPSLLAALRHVELEFPRYVVEFLEPPTSLK